MKTTQENLDEKKHNKILKHEIIDIGPKILIVFFVFYRSLMAYTIKKKLSNIRAKEILKLL